MTATRQDDTEARLEEAAEAFLGGEHRLQRLRYPYQGLPAWDETMWRKMARQGWLALALPEALGGSGLGAREAAGVARAMGRHAVPEPFIACGVMPAVLAARLGTPAGAWAPLVDALVGGECVATLAWQDDARVLESGGATVAHWHGADAVLEGAKEGVVAASWSRWWLVSAVLDGEPSLWCVASDSPGIAIEEHLASDGGQVGRMRFDKVKLPRTALLAHGTDVTNALDFAVQHALLLSAAHLLGLAQRAQELTFEYLRTRVQFGKPVGSYQSLQHPAVDVRVQQALAAGAWQAALRLYEADPLSAGTRAAVSRAKARASDAALMAGRFGVQAHGAIGYAAEADIGLYLKAAVRWAAWLGNGSFHRAHAFALATQEALA